MNWRFDHFREIVARFDSTGCINGADHEIRKGDRIGYARIPFRLPPRGRAGMACCAPCWQRWTAENAAASAAEASYAPQR